MSEGGAPAVFGLGQCSLDYLRRAASFPAPDSKCELADLAVQGGGPVATALVALSRWGVPCSFAGVVGGDGFGEAIARSLVSEGIDTAGLLRREGSSSQFAFIAVEEGGRRTIFWRRPTGPPLSAGEVDMNLVARSRVLLTDGLFIEASIAAARRAREAGVDVVVDGGTLRKGMLGLARHSDHFICSETFARAMVGTDDAGEACRRIAALGPKVAGVTLGRRGYAAFFDGRHYEGPAYHVEAVDTTGCGDVFHAGYVYGLLQGWEVRKRLDFGAWAASRASLRLGGRAGIPPASTYPGFPVH